MGAPETAVAPEPAAAPARVRRRRSHPALIGGVVVLAVFIGVEFVAAAVAAAPRPALSVAALRPVLPGGAASAPVQRWTNASSGATGGPLDLAGRAPVVVAACEGGGAISIDLSATTAVTLDCTDRSTAGPVVLDAAEARGIGVEATDGNPRYVVELLAVER